MAGSWLVFRVFLSAWAALAFGLAHGECQDQLTLSSRDEELLLEAADCPGSHRHTPAQAADTGREPSHSALRVRGQLSRCLVQGAVDRTRWLMPVG